jgi:hypothetical protein
VKIPNEAAGPELQVRWTPLRAAKWIVAISLVFIFAALLIWTGIGRPAIGKGL